MINVIVDSCFWYALYDERDEHHAMALKLSENLDGCRLIIPFPTLYETLNTRFAKNRNIKIFRDFISSDKCFLLHDDEYKQEVLQHTLLSSIERGRPLSLVDMIIRMMLEDVSLNIGGLISFNPGDFIDVCQQHNISLFPNI